MATKSNERSPHVRVMDRIRATPTGRLILKIAIGTVGTLVVAAGILLIPFPGPGWAIVILGLAIWALEFPWAKRLLEFTKRHVLGWTAWIKRQNVPVRTGVDLVALVFVAGVVWASVRVSFDVDLVQWVTTGSPHRTRDAPTLVRVPGPRSGTVLVAAKQAEHAGSARRGRLAQRESAPFTPERSLVRSQYCPRAQGGLFAESANRAAHRNVGGPSPPTPACAPCFPAGRPPLK